MQEQHEHLLNTILFICYLKYGFTKLDSKLDRVILIIPIIIIIIVIIVIIIIVTINLYLADFNLTFSAAYYSIYSV